MLNWRLFGKKLLWPNWGNIQGIARMGWGKPPRLRTWITGVLAEVWSGGVSSPEISVCNESLVTKAWHVPWFYERRKRYVNVVGSWECVEWRYKQPKSVFLQIHGCSVDKFCLPEVEDVMKSHRVSRTLAGTFERGTGLFGFIEGEKIRGITEYLLASQKNKRVNLLGSLCWQYPLPLR